MCTAPRPRRAGAAPEPDLWRPTGSRVRFGEWARRNPCVPRAFTATRWLSCTLVPSLRGEDPAAEVQDGCIGHIPPHRHRHLAQPGLERRGVEVDHHAAARARRDLRVVAHAESRTKAPRRQQPDEARRAVVQLEPMRNQISLPHLAPVEDGRMRAQSAIARGLHRRSRQFGRGHGVCRELRRRNLGSRRIQDLAAACQQADGKSGESSSRPACRGAARPSRRRDAFGWVRSHRAAHSSRKAKLLATFWFGTVVARNIETAQRLVTPAIGARVFSGAVLLPPA